MRKIYTSGFILLLLVFFASCSKDFLKRYDKRIVGTWEIEDINRHGIGGSSNLPFDEGGIFTFSEDGTLSHSFSGRTYQGSWDIRKELREDKNSNSLHITAIDFANQQVLSEFFNEILFTSTNKFKAYIYLGTRTYVYHFRRQ